MRAAVALSICALACSRREAPTAIGGGPRAIVESPASAKEARAQIARARCTIALSCGDILELDPCITREEAKIALPCTELDRAHLELCLERTRARTCTESTALTECAADNLCSPQGGNP